MPRDVSKYVLPDGTKVPSVTEALDMAGFIDLTRIPFPILEEARERGTAVHAWIELQTKSPTQIRGLDPPEVIAPYIAAWEKFMAETDFRIERAEEAVVCRTYRYAGTYDALGRCNGGRWLVDYKARYGLTPEVGPQTAGYLAALHSARHVDPSEPIKRFALLLRRDGSYRLEPQDKREDLHAFRHAVGVAHWQLNNRIVRLDDIRRAA